MGDFFVGFYLVFACVVDSFFSIIIPYELGRMYVEHKPPVFLVCFYTKKSAKFCAFFNSKMSNTNGRLDPLVDCKRGGYGFSLLCGVQ